MIKSHIEVVIKFVELLVVESVELFGKHKFSYIKIVLSDFEPILSI